MSDTLLMTGGRGLLGSAVRRLCPDAVAVDTRDADLRDIGQVRRVFDRVKPRVVLHLAARVGGVKANAEHNAELFADNISINTNVLRVAQERGVSRLISVLSSCAFQLYADRPSTEEDLHVGMPFEGNLGYSCAKRMLDIHTRLLARQYGCRFSTIAPVTMYGPHDDFDLDGGHVIGALIHKCYLAQQEGRPLTVWGSGRAVRQFVFVDDVAAVLLRMLREERGPETTIIASDGGVTIRQLTELVARVMGFQGPVVYDTTKPEGVPVKRLTSTKDDPIVRCFPFTPMEVGVRKTVEWFLSHTPEARAGYSVQRA